MAVLWDPVLLYCCFFIVITMGQKEVAQTRCVPTDEVEFQPSTLGTPIVLLILKCLLMLLLVKFLNFLDPAGEKVLNFSGESQENYGEAAE